MDAQPPVGFRSCGICSVRSNGVWQVTLVERITVYSVCGVVMVFRWGCFFFRKSCLETSMSLTEARTWIGYSRVDQPTCLATISPDLLQPGKPFRGYPAVKYFVPKFGVDERSGHAVCGESGSGSMLPKKARSLVTGGVMIRVRDANCQRTTFEPLWPGVCASVQKACRWTKHISCSFWHRRYVSTQYDQKVPR